jgi:hypothetical protein
MTCDTVSCEDCYYIIRGTLRGSRPCRRPHRRSHWGTLDNQIAAELDIT